MIARMTVEMQWMASEVLEFLEKCRLCDNTYVWCKPGHLSRDSVYQLQRWSLTYISDNEHLNAEERVLHWLFQRNNVTIEALILFVCFINMQLFLHPNQSLLIHYDSPT